MAIRKRKKTTRSIGRRRGGIGGTSKLTQRLNKAKRAERLALKKVSTQTRKNNQTIARMRRQFNTKLAEKSRTVAKIRREHATELRKMRKQLNAANKKLKAKGVFGRKAGQFRKKVRGSAKRRKSQARSKYLHWPVRQQTRRVA